MKVSVEILVLFVGFIFGTIHHAGISLNWDCLAYFSQFAVGFTKENISGSIHRQPIHLTYKYFFSSFSQDGIDIHSLSKGKWVLRFKDGCNKLSDCKYRSGTLNSNTVNSKFHLIRSFFEILATILSFHV